MPTGTLLECPGYDNKPNDDEAPVLDLWGMWSTPSLALLPGPTWHWVVIPVRVPSVGQIEQFNHLLYLKSSNCGQTKD